MCSHFEPSQCSHKLASLASLDRSSDQSLKFDLTVMIILDHFTI